jgi:DNA-binding transcriptional ArsR family regulator
MIMAFPKNELFPHFDQDVSACGRILGHPARLCILQLLEESGPKHVKALVREIPLSEGTITEHLRKLRIAGLIDVKVNGLINSYSINTAVVEQLYRMQMSFFERLLIGTAGWTT